jgi:hypothetical protein
MSVEECGWIIFPNYSKKVREKEKGRTPSRTSTLGNGSP